MSRQDFVEVQQKTRYFQVLIQCIINKIKKLRQYSVLLSLSFLKFEHIFLEECIDVDKKHCKTFVVLNRERHRREVVSGFIIIDSASGRSHTVQHGHCHS